MFCYGVSVCFKINAVLMQELTFIEKIKLVQCQKEPQNALYLLKLLTDFNTKNIKNISWSETED